MVLEKECSLLFSLHQELMSLPLWRKNWQFPSSSQTNGTIQGSMQVESLYKRPVIRLLVKSRNSASAF